MVPLRLMLRLMLNRRRYQSLDPDKTEEDHQYPLLDMELKSPMLFRRPPGRAVKPEEFVAPEFGEFHPPGVGCVAVLFNEPPAKLDPPKWFSRVVHSASDGICQPVGHNPLLSVTA